MNSTKAPGGPQRTRHPLSDDAKASLAKTHTLFRLFIVAVLGAFFVFQLDVSYFWLSGILTVVAIVLGIILLVRAAKLKESKLVLVGTIAGLAVSALMVLLVLTTALFFDQIHAFQECSQHALTQQALTECTAQLENSMPQFR
jgi:hypothetical protein